MQLKIGSRSTHEVADFAQASEIYCTERDMSGEGASTFPEGTIIGANGPHHVSYNGKVWKGKWVAGATPVYNPYAVVA
jgi:hypothetical protein